MWVIESDLADEDLPEGTLDNPIVRGDWVFATQDSNSYDKEHWEKRDTNITKEMLENNYYTTSETQTLLNTKLENYVNVSTFQPIQSKIQHFENDYYTKDEIQQKLTDGSVTKVRTISCQFDENGMTYFDGDADSHTTINAEGVRVKKNGGNEETVLFAGYVGENNTQYSSNYKGQSIVAAENVVVDNWLVVGNHSRFQDYEPNSNTHGTGCFYI